MDLSAASALAVLSKLQLLGFCAGLQIPDDAADPSEVFDAVLAAFLREVYLGERDARPLPAALGDGRRVDLFRLFTAVRAAGGYAVASSPSAGAGVWAAAAGSAALAAPVKLLYAKYLGALERWIQRLPEAQPPPSDEMQEKRQELLCVCGANGVQMEDCNGRDQQHGAPKRKREDIAGMLDWVRGLAESLSEEGAIAAGLADGYFPVALAAREAVARKRARRASVTNGALLQEIGCRCCRSTTCARIGVQCSKKLQLLVQQPGSDTNKLTAVVEGMNRSSMVIESGSNLNGQLKYSTSQRRNKLLVGSNYQAVVPQWTGVLPENYGDPETLKWLGTKIWPPENQNKIAPVYCDPIGKGREDACSCNIPRSVECVRFHIAERRLQLRRELGSAFYGWGFDRMGEEVALSWTDEEEANFKAVMQINAPSYSSGRNLLNHLHSSLRWKPRKELVSYYFNCFLLRRRCYQNRTTPKKVDSDDEEETEFRFFGNRMGQSATKYDSSKRTVCIQSTHCMDLDDE